MSKIIKTELYKLKYNKSFYLIILVLIGAHVALAFLDPEDNSFDIIMTSFSSLLPLFSAVVCVSLTQSDYNAGTLKNVVSSGVSRTSIYLGKLFVVFVATAILFLVEAIASLVMLFVSTPNVVIDFAIILPSILLQLVVALNYTVVFFLIASVIKSSAFAVISCYIFYLFDAYVIGCIGNFLHISGLDDHALGAVTTAVERVSVDTVSIVNLGIITAIIVVFALVGTIVFSKQDIK